MHELPKVIPLQRGDPDFAERVESRVQHLMAGRVRDFRVQIHDRGLVLRGRTRTYHAKQLVRQMAMEAAGMPILADEVEVC
jgi:hypothetical protein